MRMIPLGCKNEDLKHVLSFRRQVFMFLNSASQALDASFRVRQWELLLFLQVMLTSAVLSVVIEAT